MGSKKQYNWVKSMRGALSDPICEIGSYVYGSSQPYRNLFKDCDYLGIDMQLGPGVDLQWDMTTTVPPHLYNRFNTVLCLSVLEHCKAPWKMASAITSILRVSGSLVISVPFCWKVHAYPCDYWRFTQSAISELFPEIAWEEPKLVQYDWPFAVRCLTKAIPPTMLDMVGRKL